MHLLTQVVDKAVKMWYNKKVVNASMAELADAPDLGSGGEIRAGSIPVTRIQRGAPAGSSAPHRCGAQYFSVNESDLQGLAAAESLRFFRGVLFMQRRKAIPFSYRIAV